MTAKDDAGDDAMTKVKAICFLEVVEIGESPKF